MDESLLVKRMQDVELGVWAQVISAQIKNGLDVEKHGDLPRWQKVVDGLPDILVKKINLNDSAISVVGDELNVDAQESLKQQLKNLMPWRKGPYNIHGIHIDTEWRSDWKWERLKSSIQPLKNKVVLDVGCGNGYHGWRMIGEGARLVLGVDPSPLFVMQHQCVKHFTGDVPFYVLPLGIESVPDNLQVFDTVFSMGVLYHR